jgi:hypothetical protein
MQHHQANTASTRSMQADIIAAHAKVDRMFPPQELCAMQQVSESIILSACAESIIVSASPAESMILSALRNPQTLRHGASTMRPALK